MTLTSGALVLVAALGGCANSDAQNLVRQACAHVERSIKIYEASNDLPPPQKQASMAEALAELRAALPLAATAAGESSQWQALVTTLSEISRVPESYLVGALGQQCAAAGTPPQTTPSTSTGYPGVPTTGAQP